MAVIGKFVPTKEGGWAGSVQSLLIERKVRLVPNDNRENEAAPAYRVFAGDSEVGAAWRKRSAGDLPRDYLSVTLDDPALPQAISGALFESDDGKELKFIWNRRP